MSRENARLPIHKRPLQEELAFWADYEAILLNTAGVEVPKELALPNLTRLRQLDRRLILFDDVLPILDTLKAGA